MSNTAEGSERAIDTPRAVALLAGLLGLELVHVRRRVVREGTRSVHVVREVYDPSDQELVAKVGIGHGTVFWSEP